MKKTTPLNIWILKDGEPLPVEKNSKKLRTWRLSEALADRGHSVTWWTSNLSRATKERVFKGDHTLKLRDNLTIKFLDCGVYKKNISFQRVKHHFSLGKKFAEFARKADIPDIIIASLPILEFPIEAIKYGKAHNIPVIVDVRDMWPDIFTLYIPFFLRPFLLIPIFLYNIKIKFCLKKANGIVSMNEDLLSWALKKASLNKDEHKRVFYLGYDESCAQETEIIKELETIPNNKKIFSYLGSFNNSNDLDLIVEAAEILERDEKLNIHFILAGDGDLWNSIKEKVKNVKNITLLGWLNKGQSSYLMNLTDVNIIPSKVPAIPNKFFEALFFGNPILFCMEGEAKSILESHNVGVFYKNGNVSSLVSNTKSLLEDKKLQEMKKNSRELYDNHFKDQKIYSAYCEYIEKIHSTYKNDAF